MISLNEQYFKERDDICRYLRSQRLLKNVSILGQPPLIGRVLGDVMKLNPLPIGSSATESDQIAYILTWWERVKAQSRQKRM